MLFLIADAGTPVNPAAKRHLHQYILPAVALSRTLRDAGESREGAVETIERILRKEFASRRKILMFLGRLPLFYKLLQWTARRNVQKMCPDPEWQIDWLEVSPEKVAFNTRKCFYVDVFESYGVPELTAPFCRIDDYLYKDCSNQMEWARTGTLGSGQPACDFRMLSTSRKRN